MAKGKAKNPLKLNGIAWDREAVLTLIAERLETMDLRKACKDGFQTPEGKQYGLPTPSTIGEWLSEDPQWAGRCARARKLRAAHLAEEALELVDKEPDKDNRGQMDRGAIRWAESRAKQRNWLAERLDPEQYGAQLKVDHHHHGAIDIRQVLAEAQGRVIEGKAERLTPALELPDDVGDMFD